MTGPRITREQKIISAQRELVRTAAEVVKRVRSGDLVFALNIVDESSNLFIKRPTGYFAIMSNGEVGGVKSVEQKKFAVCDDLSDLKRIQQLLDEYLGR